MNTDRTMGHGRAPAEEPHEEDVAQVRGNLAEHHEGLEEHDPAALTIAAHALLAIDRCVHRQIKAIRSDRTRRFRAKQIAGQIGLPLEDLVAISHEGDLGHAAASDALRILAQAMGFALTPLEARAVSPGAAALSLVDEAVAAGTAIARDDQDGRIDEPEAHAARLQRVSERLADTAAAIAPGIAAFRRKAQERG